MSSQEFQLILMDITMVLISVLVLLFIVRGIKVLATRRIYTKDDLIIVLFLAFIVTIGMYWFYKIKRYFKKLK